ncbi:hypothetical protein JN27_19430 [Massilia sp. BSC265]|nr:hypothetical protein JN27_19430 [Massilia sp. BSC265]
MAPVKTLVRTLLVWFVLLAVPFQGFAAAAMTCAHGVGTAPANETARHLATHVAKAAAKPPCHGDAAQAGQHPATHAATQAAATDGAQDEAASSHQQSCGNCSACSVGAAMAPASNRQAPSCCPCCCCPSAAPERVALADADLPERPPRTILA